MTEKEKLFSRINNPTRITVEMVNKPCTVNWNNADHAIEATFSKEELESMSEETVSALLKLANKMSSVLLMKENNGLS